MGGVAEELVCITSYNTAYVYINNLKFLVDTGASVSLLKQQHCPREIQYQRTIKIRGISGNMMTLGTCELMLKIGSNRVQHEFHVIPNNFETSFSGILGSDFLSKYKSIVDY